MSKETASNHGEGNPEAAERFNQAEREFVNSDRGKQKIKAGAGVRPGEETELEAAEQRAREHAKDDDSDTTAMRR
jgi:hypothetical protein